MIDLAGAGIIVDGYNVGLGICLTQRLNDALAYHMVGKAAKGLGTDNIGYVVVDQLHHFTGKEPSFPGLIADGDNGLRKGSDFPDGSGSGKMSALFKLLCRGASEHMFDGPDTKL